MEKLSDRDIHDITTKTKLSHAQLHHLFHELDIADNDVENAERIADSRDFQLQANKVLKMWRAKIGNNATRRRIIDALTECSFNEGKAILEEKWGLTVQGKYQTFSDLS